MKDEVVKGERRRLVLTAALQHCSNTTTDSLISLIFFQSGGLLMITGLEVLTHPRHGSQGSDYSLHFTAINTIKSSDYSHDYSQETAQ